MQLVSNRAGDRTWWGLYFQVPSLKASTQGLLWVQWENPLTSVIFFLLNKYLLSLQQTVLHFYIGYGIRHATSILVHHEEQMQTIVAYFWL